MTSDDDEWLKLTPVLNKVSRPSPARMTPSDIYVELDGEGGGGAFGSSPTDLSFCAFYKQMKFFTKFQHYFNTNCNML